MCTQGSTHTTLSPGLHPLALLQMSGSVCQSDKPARIWLRKYHHRAFFEYHTKFNHLSHISHEGTSVNKAQQLITQCVYLLHLHLLPPGFKHSCHLPFQFLTQISSKAVRSAQKWMQSRTGNTRGIFKQDASAQQKHRMDAMRELSKTLGTGSSIWMEEHLSNAANPDCGRSGEGYTGMLRVHFWVAVAPGHKMQGAKLLLEDTYHPNRIYVSCFVTLLSICWAARTAHQKPGLRPVSSGEYYVVLEMGEPNQQTIGLPGLHMAGMYCFFVQFLVLHTSVSFCLQRPMPPMQQHTENQCLSLGAQFMLFNESG